MINNRKILAIIPARGGSKGVKNKNVKILNKKPAIYWPYISAKKTKVIDKIILSTDSPKILKIAKKLKIDAPFTRPKKYATDKASSYSVIKHTLDFYKKKKVFFDYVILLEPTSPLTEASDIKKALIKLISRPNKFDSLVSVSFSSKHHPQYFFKKKREFVLPFSKKVNNLSRQNLEKLYFIDGSLYISKVSSYLKNKGFICKKTTFIEMPKIKSFEIDDLLDYKIINFLFKK
jgi:N-acylneuraminate cytidylyltransferase/CMP-N,N'-diacetyllegionaminic acid synthase